ncbi:WD repeat-containing protein 36 [Neocloeon triangulifer]|uniref:WD repeat-containing protein 36 n=1 Tax=Neocloeon triangulifer TaxID=2078957 RepID=UPI00286F963F|nr:WD repeat-containing protein 36 [Neocloeon triangulifer]
MSTGSRIFAQNRALGFVSNHIPLEIRYIERRKENLVLTCVGRHFHTYGSFHFTLINTSGEHPEEITAMAADKYYVYTAAGNKVMAWRGGTHVKHNYVGHDLPVHLLLPIGSHLVSVDEGNCLKVWHIDAAEIYTEIQFELSFEVTALMHPATYTNKILLGSQQGQMQLWNLHTRKLIYTFSGWGSGVSVIEQAPALDVVAVGLFDGRILVHNLKYDETIIDFSQDWGQVTSITFRTDGPPLMYTGTNAGHIITWDLEKKEHIDQIWNAHYGPVTGLKCLPSEPLMVSSSPDNSLKMWIFDMADGGARLLKIREGHSLPPTFIKFHRQDQIFTTGADSTLKVFSTVTETKNHSYGRAVYNKKAFKRIKNKRSPDAPLVMPPMIELASEATREKDWDSVCALHRGLAEVTTWSSDKGCMGEHRLSHKRFQEQPELRAAVATSICITHCGNFVLVGYSTGHMDRFNLQSGLHRCEYKLPKDLPAHKGAVRGISTEGLNQSVVSGGADAFIRFWNFQEGKTLGRLAMSQAVAFFCQNRNSSLLGIALDDNSLCVVDILSRNIIRRLPNHQSRLTSTEFSQDARWILTSTTDCKIRTWDVPSANMIDVFKVPLPVTRMALNLTGELLATIHVDSVGVYLWFNKVIHMYVSLRPLPFDAEAILAGLPSQGYNELEILDSDLQDVVLEEEEYKSPEQLKGDLITLSTLSTSRWVNVLDLDIIKRRNKPKEKPKAPSAAPFFLPTIPSLEYKFDLRPTLEEQQEPTPQGISDLSRLAKMLVESAGDTEKLSEFLKTLGPSALDAEILNLSGMGDSITSLANFVDFVRSLMEQKKDFELAQMYLALFLKHHGDQCIADQTLSEKIELLREIQQKGWAQVEKHMLYCKSVVHALKRL